MIRISQLNMNRSATVRYLLAQFTVEVNADLVSAYKPLCQLPFLRLFKLTTKFIRDYVLFSSDLSPSKLTSFFKVIRSVPFLELLLPQFRLLLLSRCLCYLACFFARRLHSSFILGLAVHKPDASYHVPFILTNISAFHDEFTGLYDFVSLCDKGRS